MTATGTTTTNKRPNGGLKNDDDDDDDFNIVETFEHVVGDMVIADLFVLDMYSGKQTKIYIVIPIQSGSFKFDEANAIIIKGLELSL